MAKPYTTNGSCTARNLESNKLHGVIFGCKNKTINECLTKNLFGLPAPHFSYVRKVRPGLTLFLFNYSDRTLHGIFEAASPGQLNINRHGWISDGEETTPYPAQVKVKVRQWCMPLSEEKFQPIIQGNYYEPRLFWFELDEFQTKKLVDLFMSSPVRRNPRLKTKDISASTSNTPIEVNNGKSWSSLFKPSTQSDQSTGEEDSEIFWEEDPWNSAPVDDQNFEVDATSSNAYNDIDTAPLFPRTETDSAKGHQRNSLDLLMDVAQLVKEFKLSQLEQNRRISSLEQALIESKSEIQHLRIRSVLAPGPSVYMVGGNNGSSLLTNIDSYSVSRDLMRSISQMTFLRSYFSVTTLDDKLYVLGGAEGNVWYDTVESYSPSTDEWRQLPSLTKKKGSVASASLFGNIFAIGGENGADVFSEVEKLDFNLGKWIGVQSMNQKRFASSATGIDNTLYVVGGFDGKDYLSSSARLDPREEKWTKIGTMHSRRGCHSTVAFNGKLFALGGFDGSKMVPSVEVLDPRFGSWVEASPMVVSRGYSGAVVMDGKIYIFGGIDQANEIINTIECYSEDNGWQMTNLKGMGKRSFFSAVVL